MDGLQGSEHAADSIFLPLTWDEYIDLVDGGSIGSLLKNKSSNPHVDAVVRSLLDRVSSSDQFFFDSSKRAAEVFWLKISLCEAICRHVAEEHEHNSRSYVVLDPAHVMVQVRTKALTFLPVFWDVSVTIDDVRDYELAKFAEMPEEMAKGLRTIPVGADLNYAAPLVKLWPLGREMSAAVIIESADLIPADDSSMVTGLIRAHMISDEITAQDFSERDVFRLMLPLGTSRGVEMRAWARKVGSPERGIVVSGMIDPVPTDTWNAFTQRVKHVRSDAKVAVYRSFGSAFDVYSCGMLLLRALFGVESGRWAHLLDVLPMLLDGLSPLVQGVESEDHYTIHFRLKDRLQEFGDLFQPRSIPQDVWWDALIVAFRACSRIRGFSYGYDEPLTEHSTARHCARDLALIARRARLELFGSENRDRMVARVCERVLVESLEQP